jgi:RimJ/RimL family protein N-acetyltransferase
MVRLAYFTPADYQQLIDWIHDEHILTNWAGSLFRFPLNPSKLDWYLENSNDPETSDVLIYKAIDTSSQKVIGHISLGSINRGDRSARITRVLVGNTAERGKGYCQGMIKALLAIAFNDLKLHRVSLGVYSFNEAALKCYQKAGFMVEGTMRDVKLFEGKYWSLIEMGILEDEWREKNT